MGSTRTYDMGSTQCAPIHVHDVGFRANVVTLLDQMVRFAKFSCGFFITIAREKASAQK